MNRENLSFVQVSKEEAERLILYMFSEESGVEEMHVRFWDSANTVIDKAPSGMRIHKLMESSNYGFRCNFMLSGTSLIKGKHLVFSSILKNNRVLLGSLYTSKDEAEETDYALVSLIDNMPHPDGICATGGIL